MVDVDVRSILVATLLHLGIGMTAFAEDVDSGNGLNLATGQSREVTFPETAEVRVTRRGIVDVFHERGTTWRLTGLRGGFVIVEAFDPESGAPIAPRYHVTVGSNSGHRSRARAPARWICREPGVSCDASTGTIAGRTADWDWYVRTYAQCSDDPSCYFRVRLNDDGVAAARATIGALLGGEYALRPLPDGRLTLASPCDAEGRPRRLTETLSRLGSATQSGLITLGCHTEREGLAYRLNARLFLATAGTARRLGFAPETTLRLAAAPVAATAGYAASLAALEHDRDVEAVGSPVTRLLPDRQAEIVSGGEFQVVEPDKDGDGLRAAWKQHGLTLKVRATPLANGHARLSIDGTLKFRTGGQQSLTVSSLTTELDVVLGSPTHVATLDLATTEAQTDFVPFLGKLPLFGPLFTTRGRDRASTRLIVWLGVDEASPTTPLFPVGKSAP